MTTKQQKELIKVAEILAEILELELEDANPSLIQDVVRLNALEDCKKKIQEIKSAAN